MTRLSIDVCKIIWKKKSTFCIFKETHLCSYLVFFALYINRVFLNHCKKYIVKLHQKKSVDVFYLKWCNGTPKIIIAV